MLYNVVLIYRRFGRIYNLHISGRGDCFLHAFMLPVLLLDTEDGGNTFFRNVSTLLPHYRTPYPRRQYCPQSPILEPQIFQDDITLFISIIFKY
jgi:hypothetical protein